MEAEGCNNDGSMHALLQRLEQKTFPLIKGITSHSAAHPNHQLRLQLCSSPTHSSLPEPPNQSRTKQNTPQSDHRNGKPKGTLALRHQPTPTIPPGTRIPNPAPPPRRLPQPPPPPPLAAAASERAAPPVCNKHANKQKAVQMKVGEPDQIHGDEEPTKRRSERRIGSAPRGVEGCLLGALRRV